MPQPGASSRDVLLVGGGHAHVLLLRRWSARPPGAARVTLLSDGPAFHYSGMVPGFVAGQYAADALAIDLRALAARAGARFVLGTARRVDALARAVEWARGGAGKPGDPGESAGTLRYDVASLDVGAGVLGGELPDVRAHALATRPMADFVARLDPWLAGALRAAERGAPRLVVVGGGAAGCELALALLARLRGLGEVALVEAGDALLGGRTPRLAAAVSRALGRRGIAVRLRTRVAEVGPGGLALGGGERLPCDGVVWAAGPAPPPLLAASALARDAHGFARVRPTLQVAGDDSLFCVGDAASFDAGRDVPKAGVYAVRAAPVLAANLEARLAGRSLRAFHPQPAFLALLNCGDGTAIGGKWGAVFDGRLAFRLKDAIDRRFVDGLRGPG